MHTGGEGPPSRHITPADLDAAALVLVIPPDGEASLWLGEPRGPEAVGAALRRVADEVDTDLHRGRLRALVDAWDAESGGPSPITLAVREAAGFPPYQEAPDG